MRSHWRFSISDDLVFGRGVAQQTGAEVLRLGCQRALIITDVHLIKAGLVAQVQHSLDAAGIAHVVFDGCVPEPSTVIIDAAVAFFRSRTPSTDAVIGLGGGSNMDVAKIVSAVLAHGGQASDYFGQDKIPGPTLPLIAIPTTAGTGSEVSAVAGMPFTMGCSGVTFLTA